MNPFNGDVKAASKILQKSLDSRSSGEVQGDFHHTGTTSPTRQQLLSGVKINDEMGKMCHCSLFKLNKNPPLLETYEFENVCNRAQKFVYRIRVIKRLEDHAGGQLQENLQQYHKVCVNYYQLPLL